MSDATNGGPVVVRVDAGEGRFHRHGLIKWWDQERLSRSTALVPLRG